MLQCIGARLCVASAAVLFTAAHAAQERRETLDALERERLQQQRDSLHRQELSPAYGVAALWRPPVGGEAPCFWIQSAELTADERDRPELQHFAWLLRNLSGYEHACLGAHSLENLRANLQDRLQAEGFLTSSVELPAQNLGAGRVLFKLRLGRVAGHAVHMPHAARPSVASNAIAFSNGQVLRLQDIEQTLENLARLRGSALQFQIEPGPEVQTSIVAIHDLGEKRWGLSVGLDNAAPAEFGRQQLSVNASLDSPFGIADQLSASLIDTRHASGRAAFQGSALVSYSVPLGRHLFSANLSMTTHHRSVHGASVVFSEDGYDRSSQWRWQWTAWRSPTVRHSVWLGLVTRESRNFIEDTELLLQRRRSKALELGFNTATRWGKTQIDLSGEVSRGLRLSTDPELDLAVPDLPRTSRFQLSLTRPFDTPAVLGGAAWGYQARMFLNHVESPASASDLSPLGGRWTIRGIGDENALVGRSVFALQQEVQLPWRELGHQLQAQPFAALDVGGELRSLQAGEAERRLAGVAVGFRFARDYLTGELVLSRPIHLSAASSANGVQLYLNLFASF